MAGANVDPNRCRSGKHDCIVEGRKPRINTNFFLPKQKDELIDFLVKQLHNPTRHTTTQHLQMINTGRM
ncbi:hypothetical protein F5148DRAFT_1194348 [Russula earlei]|uniref:Uncharacterized protein n=1 Tax=Russula earlei TaxID=71964 RepID=A0ACC0UAI2_9AGAM|nr:hypothetical protein F5148DRAFT_1194348 [Russula earlei]